MTQASFCKSEGRGKPVYPGPDNFFTDDFFTCATFNSEPCKFFYRLLFTRLRMNSCTVSAFDFSESLQRLSEAVFALSNCTKQTDKIDLLIAKYSLPLPISFRASSTACFTANRLAQDMHKGGSPTASNK